MPDIDPWLSSRLGGVDRSTSSGNYKVRDTAKLVDDPASPLYRGKRRRAKQSRSMRKQLRSAERRTGRGAATVAPSRGAATNATHVTGAADPWTQVSPRVLRRWQRAERRAVGAERRAAKKASRRQRRNSPTRRDRRRDWWVTGVLGLFAVVLVIEIVSSFV